MLIHDRFVFLQMPKTASTFIAGALKQELELSKVNPYKHADWAKIPPEASELPVLTYVRNPWDWYVSWYHFNEMRGGTPNGYWRMLSENGTLGFKPTVERACTLSMKIMGGDLLTTRFRNLVGDGALSSRLTFGRFESLVDHLEDFLDAVGVDLPDGAVGRIRSAAPVNSSGHGHYRDYYDEQLRDLVAACCGPLIDRFDYRFDDTPVGVGASKRVS